MDSDTDQGSPPNCPFPALSLISGVVDLISQLWVTAFGLTAIGLMQLHRPRVRRWGVIVGLVGQPGWYTQLVIHEQWGMLPVFCGYTGLWLFGLWNLWLCPRGVVIDRGQ